MAKKDSTIISTTLTGWLMAAAFLGGCTGQYRAAQHYEPTWKSLKQHTTPQWLSDAKFGIYTHWQPRSRNPEEFKAEKFDAQKWAQLFKKAGAQFAGPVLSPSTGADFQCGTASTPIGMPQIGGRNVTS